MTWLAVIQQAHASDRNAFWRGLGWLCVWTILGSVCAIAFIEGLW